MLDKLKVIEFLYTLDNTYKNPLEQNIIQQFWTLLNKKIFDQEWFLEESKPVSGKEVLICYKNDKQIITRGFYAARYSTIQFQDFGSLETLDGETYLMEGWYECSPTQEFEDAVDWTIDNVTHWMPLPEPPEEE